MNIRDSAVTKRILLEARALQDLLGCVESGDVPTAELLTLVREVRDNGVGDNTEGHLMSRALARILGETFEPDRFPLIPPGQADSRFFEYVAKAWSCWAAGDNDAADVLFKTLIDDEHTEIPGGHLHMMALHPWCDAVVALVAGNPDEAQRLYRRSMEAGSQFGTHTNVAVQWSYVASFLAQV